jgi:hypothetical protein
MKEIPDIRGRWNKGTNNRERNIKETSPDEEVSDGNAMEALSLTI